MRKLKFRAWSEEQKKLIQGYPLGEDQKNGFTVCGVSENGEQETTSDGLVLMQFTGLVDKNGKEIYEGDVLQKYITDYEHEDYQEFVDSGYETIEPMKKITDVCSLEHFRYWLKNESFGYEGEDLESPEDWEIIGNIYENPELI